MKRLLKKRWFWAAWALLLCLALAVLPDSRWRIVGWVKGESFYRDRPTSYWSLELQSWSDVCGFPFRSDAPTKHWSREPSRWELWASKYLPFALSRVGQSQSPALIDGDADAVPVLIELLAQENWKVRRIAAEGLGKIGAPAQPAWPKLRAALAAYHEPLDAPPVESTMDEETKFRYYAAKALFAIDPAASRAAGLEAPRPMMAWGW